jgi:porphobilinogen synthase
MVRSENQASFPAYRPRRLRTQPTMRDMVRENTLTPMDLIWPVFVMDGQDAAHPIPSMPGISRHTVDRLPALAAQAHSLGIPCICVFPYTNPELKTQDCAEAWNLDNLSNRAIRAIKEATPEIMVMTDIALDPYNINGHDGIVRGGKILNDETVDALVKMGESQAQVGANILGPSDMMDGRIAAIRSILEKKGFSEVSLAILLNMHQDFIVRFAMR